MFDLKFVSQCRTQGGGKRGTCPPEATASHTLPPEKNVMQNIGTSASQIPARLLSVKMVGH